MKNRDACSLARKAVEYAQTKKALDIKLMDLREVTSVADFFVICHGESDVQVRAISEAVLEGLRKEGARVWHREGMDFCRWVLLDYVDVVVHVFLEETRDFYCLEKLWGDAKVQQFSD
ncbi:MAG TPA: ribosome silencing factor [bacterium]|nr:ribosome silencing factor [bacterium]